MKIAIAQLNPTIGDITGNAQQILEVAHTAASQDVRLLLTPELSLCGYPPRDLLLNPKFRESMTTQVQQLAQQLPLSLAVLVGTVTPNTKAELAGGKPLYNSIALLEGGKVRQIFHKRLLPTYDVFDENRYFEPGRESNSFTIDDQPSAIPTENAHSPIKIGVTICEDLWNDEEFWGKRSYQVNPITDLVQEGVNLVVNLSASPYSAGKQKTREAMLRHSASRYHTPILYANQLGGNDDLIFDGCSVAFNQAGEMVCRARAFETDLVIVEYDRETQDLVTPPETTIQSPASAAIAPAPASLDEEIWSALVLGVRDYTRKCGFKKVVIGLSGGIDSALVAAVATAALGPDNVLGILMPSPYSSEHSVKDALSLAQNLGIKTHTLAIGSLMEGFDQTLASLFAGTEFGVAEENIQSRIRGSLLMAIANKFGYLLLSTGNKSEMAVGYCTLYGDMNGGLAVIADVPKTRVYSLCWWLNSRAEESQVNQKLQVSTLNVEPSDSSSKLQANQLQPGNLTDSNATGEQPLRETEIIPANILIKPPSAELKPGQVDQDSLPSYDILDDILERLIHQHQAPEQIIDAGHQPEVVNKILRLVARVEFKRRQAPPGLKVTDRAFGTGWRMPIASRWL